MCVFNLNIIFILIDLLIISPDFASHPVIISPIATGCLYQGAVHG